MTLTRASACAKLWCARLPCLAQNFDDNGAILFLIKTVGGGWDLSLKKVFRAPNDANLASFFALMPPSLKSYLIKCLRSRQVEVLKLQSTLGAAWVERKLWHSGLRCLDSRLTARHPFNSRKYQSCISKLTQAHFFRLIIQNDDISRTVVVLVKWFSIERRGTIRHGSVACDLH